jgi:hypothetical protein
MDSNVILSTLLFITPILSPKLILNDKEVLDFSKAARPAGCFVGPLNSTVGTLNIPANTPPMIKKIMNSNSNVQQPYLAHIGRHGQHMQHM